MTHHGHLASDTSLVNLMAILLALPLMFVLTLTNCTGESHGLQQLINEGLGITKSINFSSSPEDKIATAQKLLEHAKQYDPVVSGAPEQESTKARRFQRQEREKAATLLREAAEDYTKQHDVPKARAVYQSVIDQYPEDESRHIRAAAEASLKALDTP